MSKACPSSSCRRNSISRTSTRFSTAHSEDARKSEQSWTKQLGAMPMRLQFRSWQTIKCEAVEGKRKVLSLQENENKMKISLGNELTLPFFFIFATFWSHLKQEEGYLKFILSLAQLSKIWRHSPLSLSFFSSSSLYIYGNGYEKCHEKDIKKSTAHDVLILCNLTI